MKYHELIKEICNELNIDIKILSNDFIVELLKNNKRKYIYGYKFPLNDHALGEILDDKYGFYSLLKNLKIPTCEIYPVFLNYNKEDIINYFKKYKKLIVKSNNGTCGSEVFKVDNLDDLFVKIDMLLTKNSPICLSPFYNIKNEYRIIVLNHEIKLIYGKEKPVIIGDGVHTILELLKEFNSSYYSIKNNLKDLDVNFDHVLEKDKKLEIGFKFNLSRGSRIFMDIDVSLKEKLINIVDNVVNSFNINFASIDVIETVDNQLLVLEGNSGVMMDNFQVLNKNGRNIAKDIYKNAIISLFKN